MKKLNISKKIRNLIIALSAIMYMITGGCYTITNIIQPDIVSPNSAFDVKIHVQLDGGYEPADYTPGYGILGILMPEGWIVNDSIEWKINYSDQTGYFTYNVDVVSFLNKSDIKIPKGYYWWGAKSIDLLDIAYMESGLINLTILTNEKTGLFLTKYVIGDNIEWNKKSNNDPYGIVKESTFLQVKVNNNQQITDVISNTNIELKVYPNPVSSHVTFSWNQLDELLNLKLYQMNGSCVLEREISSNETISLINFPKGIYFYRISDNNQVIKTDKLMIQ